MFKHLLRGFLMASALMTTSTMDAQGGPGPQQVILFPDVRLSVFGLPWFDQDSPLLCRLPVRSKSSFRKEIWDLARDPSGGRIRFRTNSKKLTLKARCENDYTMFHITSIAQNGFDLYVDGFYQGSTSAMGPDRKEVGEWYLGPPGVEKEVTLYMPLYKAVTIEEIDLDAGAQVKSPKPYRQAKPVVYYGTSITQGGCASNPGMSYPAILERRLNADFVNLGFSGNGKGDLSVAEAMTEIPASAIVLDYWANVLPEEMEKTLPPFVKRLREAFPRTPILLIGPYYTLQAGTNEAMQKVEKKFVAARKKAGDRHIIFVDGQKMISRKTAYALVDGIHCNTLGFQLMADALEAPLRKALFSK